MPSANTIGAQIRAHLGLFIIAMLLSLSIGATVRTSRAADTDKRLFDRQKLEVSTGTTYVDVSAADYTSAVACLTIAPNTEHALEDVKVCIDLNDSTAGFQAAGYTTQTIQFRVARKIDGTHWRRANNLKFPSSALSANNSAGESVEIDIGTVSPSESVRVEVVLSAENADIALPYVVTYRSGARATITAVTN